MAAPLVAGTVALLRGKEPALTPVDVVNRILRSATPLIGTNLRQIDTAAIAEPCRLDIDGDGKTLATTDGLILTRVLLGMTGTAVSSAAAAGAPRNTWDAIRAYLNGSCAMNLP